MLRAKKAEDSGTKQPCPCCNQLRSKSSIRRHQQKLVTPHLRAGQAFRNAVQRLKPKLSSWEDPSEVHLSRNLSARAAEKILEGDSDADNLGADSDEDMESTEGSEGSSSQVGDCMGEGSDHGVLDNAQHELEADAGNTLINGGGDGTPEDFLDPQIAAGTSAEVDGVSAEEVIRHVASAYGEQSRRTLPVTVEDWESDEEEEEEEGEEGKAEEDMAMEDDEDDMEDFFAVELTAEDHLYESFMQDRARIGMFYAAVLVQSSR